MTMAAPQNPAENLADVDGAITAQDISQALPVGTVHKLADGEGYQLSGPLRDSDGQ